MGPKRNIHLNDFIPYKKTYFAYRVFSFIAVDRRPGQLVENGEGGKATREEERRAVSGERIPDKNTTEQRTEQRINQVHAY